MNHRPKLLILGPPILPWTRPVKYRGVHRSNPGFVECQHAYEANQAFEWFCIAGGESGVVHDLQKAASLICEYRSMTPSQEFDLIEAVSIGDQPVCKGKFLGYDISLDTGMSLLSWGLDQENAPGIGRLSPPMSFLVRLFYDHFRSHLNDSGLFDDLPVAAFCLDCAGALQEFYPALWESDPIAAFSPLQIYELPVP